MPLPKAPNKPATLLDITTAVQARASRPSAARAAREEPAADLDGGADTAIASEDPSDPDAQASTAPTESRGARPSAGVLTMPPRAPKPDSEPPRADRGGDIATPIAEPAAAKRAARTPRTDRVPKTASVRRRLFVI